MGKRSDFDRIPRDFYPTPRSAVTPLLPHLPPATRFCEPCAGDGTLIDHLTAHGHHCAAAWDTAPQRADIDTQDARTRLIGNIDCHITNPPWDRKLLHPIITNLTLSAPSWLLFDADWPHTSQAIPFLPLLRKIVSVGRVKWITDSPHTGKDNCAWYLFAEGDGPTEFFGRTREDVTLVGLDDL